jgi:hypothetical protein
MDDQQAQKLEKLLGRIAAALELSVIVQPLRPVARLLSMHTR